MATSFTTTISVDKTAEAAFNAINDPKAWWSLGIEGETGKQGGIFLYHYQDVHYSKIKVEELIPGKKVTWLVLDNYFNFAKDQTEWNGTKVIFEISPKGDHTEIKFTHEGLLPGCACYKQCESGWTFYITQSLHKLITTGNGEPNTKDDKQFDAAFEQWKSNN